MFAPQPSDKSLGLFFERPCGTWNRDTLNTYKAQKTTLTQSLHDCFNSFGAN